MAHPSVLEEFEAIVPSLSMGDLQDILSFALVKLAWSKWGIPGLGADFWEEMPVMNRLALGEFARAWLVMNGHLPKENAPSGVQPTESGQDGLTAILQS